MELVPSTHYRNTSATILQVNNWIDTLKISDHAKIHLRKIFTQTGWQVINPKGDGFCGVNAIRIGRMLIQQNISADIPQKILKHSSKSELRRQIIIGMQNYAKTRQSIIIDLAKYSENKVTKEEITQIEYIYEDTDPEIKKKINHLKLKLRKTSKNVLITDTLLDMLEVMRREVNSFVEDDNYFYFKLSLDTDFTFDGTTATLTDSKIAELYALTELENVNSAIIYFLAYYYQHNFIILYYIASLNLDVQLFTASISYISYTIETTKSLKNDNIIFNSRNSENVIENTSLLFHDGHFVLFHNPNRDIKKAVLSMFIFEKNRFILGKEDNIWGTMSALGPTADLLLEPLDPLDPLAAGIQTLKLAKKQPRKQQKKTNTKAKANAKSKRKKQKANAKNNDNKKDTDIKK